MPYTDDQLLPISALQHLLFCERQAALIHVERLWADNRWTVEGSQMHEKAHGGKVEHRPSRGVKVERAVQLVSHDLGLFGVADVVEYHQPHRLAPGSAEVPPLTAGSGGPALDDTSQSEQRTPLLIEYKRGKPKKHDADKVQLCAQALCLEQMQSTSIPAGVLFYGQTRRRQDIPFDQSLRETTQQAIARLRQIVDNNLTPTARREKKCERCSLLYLCLPDALKPRKTPSVYLEQAIHEAIPD